MSLRRRARRAAGRVLRAVGLRRPAPPPARATPPARTAEPTPAPVPAPAPRAAKAAPARRPAYVVPEDVDLSAYVLGPDEERAQAVRAAAFGHGYLVRAGSLLPLPELLAGWPVRTVGALEVRTAPRTVVTVAGPAPRERGTGGPEEHVVLLGHPLDVEAGDADAARIAARLLATLSARGADALVREAAYLAGRWTLLALHGERLTVVPDTLASQPVHYDTEGGPDVTLASSETLVALARGRRPRQETAATMNLARRIRPQGTLYLPATTSWFPGVRQVVPNCLLRVDLASGRTVHERFWPFEQRVEDGDTARVHAAFRERMHAQIELFARIGPLAWSLTAGLDSRVTLAHRPRPVPEGLFTFTYLNPGDAPKGGAADVYGANLVSYRLGVPHRVLHWRRPEAGSVFAQALRATNPVHLPSHGAAHVMWADLPHDLVEVQSNGGEIGTWHERPRTADPLTPHKAAVLWLGPRLKDRTDFDDLFEGYLEHAGMLEERLLGHDHHDLMYWEHRMGRWGCTKFLDGDYSHRQMLPFNDRAVLEIMHRLPLEQRRDKVLYTRTLQEQPQLLLP